MLTPYLEKLIHQGKARFRTHVCGISGSNSLPISDNSWIIITGFTYINFADPLTPITGSRYEAFLDRSLHQVRFRSTKSDNHWLFKDDIRRDAGAAGSSINQIANGDFAAGSSNWTLGTGWSVPAAAALHTGAAGSGILTNIGFAGLPSRTYRLTYEVTALVGTAFVSPFVGGTSAPLGATLGIHTADVLTGITLPIQLEFTGNDGAGDNITIDNISLVLLAEADIVTINGHYDVDCYLPHQNDVTVELVAFPVSSGIAVTQAAAPASFQLLNPPAGYGNIGFPGAIAQITEMELKITGRDAVQLPLTRVHTNPSLAGSDIAEDGIEIPVASQTAINQPQFNDADGPRNFPIVNVQYVEISENMPGNIRGSN